MTDKPVTRIDRRVADLTDPKRVADWCRWLCYRRFIVAAFPKG